ncbi:MAG: hypothetical protein ACJ75J_00965 [Cytophagaceae bacterium]
MKSLDNKLIIYDSNCKVCSFLKEAILAVTSIPSARIVAYKELDPVQKVKVDAARFRNEMALIDLGMDATLYGPEGIYYIFSSESRFLSLLFGNRIIFRIFYFLYRVLAYNRYMIATPKSFIECDCYPDKKRTFRIAYIAFMILFSALLSLTLVASVSYLQTGQQPIWLILWGAPFLLGLMSLFLIKQNALDYIGHLVSILFVGTLCMLPSVILYNLSDFMKWPLLVNFILSLFFMTYLHIHRLRFLGLSKAWSAGWFIIILLSGIITFN